MLFSKFYKIMVNKVTFVGFSGGVIVSIAPSGSAHDMLNTGVHLGWKKGACHRRAAFDEKTHFLLRLEIDQ